MENISKKIENDENMEHPMISFSTTYTLDLLMSYAKIMKKTGISAFLLVGICAGTFIGVGIFIKPFIYLGAVLGGLSLLVLLFSFAVKNKIVKKIPDLDGNVYQYKMFIDYMTVNSTLSPKELRISYNLIGDVQENSELFIVKLTTNLVYIIDKKNITSEYCQLKELLLSKSLKYAGMRINKPYKSQDYEYLSLEEMKQQKRLTKKFLEKIVSRMALVTSLLWIVTGILIIKDLYHFYFMIPVIIVVLCFLIIMILFTKKYGRVKGTIISFLMIIFLLLICLLAIIL